MIYIFNGKTYKKRPDPFMGRSPMTDEAFVQMGGTIEKGPQELFLESLDAYLAALEKKARDKYALNITVSEFKYAAATMMSADLIAWARAKGVPDAMIEYVRSDILVMIADASRLGMSWNDIFPKTN